MDLSLVSLSVKSQLRLTLSTLMTQTLRFLPSNETESCKPLNRKLIWKCWGTWMAQSIKHPTLDFRWGPDLRGVTSSPMLGSALIVEPAWDSLPPHLCSPTPALYLSLSLSQKKFIILRRMMKSMLLIIFIHGILAYIN